MEGNKTVVPNMQRVEKWESAWANYIAKLQRLDDLKAAGRYGYQLRIPRKAVAVACAALAAAEQS